MGRSLLAVITGFLLIAALTFGTDIALRAAIPSLYEANGATHSAPVLLLMMAYVGLYAVAGCYLCARMAPSRPRLHAYVLGALGLAATLYATIQRWDMAPAWFHVVSNLLVMVYAGVGGHLRAAELSQQPHHATGGARPA